MLVRLDDFTINLIVTNRGNLAVAFPWVRIMNTFSCRIIPAVLIAAVRFTGPLAFGQFNTQQELWTVLSVPAGQPAGTPVL